MSPDPSESNSPLLPSPGVVAMRNVFVVSAWCWTVASATVGALVGIYALSADLLIPGWLSIGFGLCLTLQGLLSFLKLGLSIRRFIRFGLTSAAFSRTSPKLITIWLVLGAASIGLYVSTLVEFVSEATAAEGEDRKVQTARMGVVWYSLIGGLMISVLVGTVVVSRITPWASSFFLRPQSDS